MRVAIVSSLFPPYAIGGAEQIAATLARALARLGHEVDVISTGEQSGVADWEGLRVWRVAHGNLYWRFAKEREQPNRLVRAAWHAVDLWNPSVFRAVGQILDKVRPEVVNTHNIDGLSPAVWQAARRHTGAIVHTLHDYHLVCPRATMRRADGTPCDRLCGLCGVYAHYHRLFQRCVRTLIAPSRAIAEMHRQAGWRGPAVKIVRNAVDVPAFEPRLASGPLRVLFMSRLEREKGCETLLSVMPRCRDIEFHVAGSGPYAQQFSESTAAIWHGFVSGDAKHELLSNTDVFLQLSECRENAPLGLIEARQYGLYLVGTEMGGIPELIGMGRLIPARDAEKLFGTLQELARSKDAIRSGLEERIRASAGYGTREMAEAYLDVFHSSMAITNAAINQG